MSDEAVPAIDTRLVLRGHHLLCILGFRGLGYDRTFVENFAGVVSRVIADPQAVVTVTDCCDVICASCPHKKSGKCAKSPDINVKLARRDRAVLGRLGLTVGSSRSVERIYGLVTVKISPTDVKRELCASCQWLGGGMCLEGLRVLRRDGFSAWKEMYECNSCRRQNVSNANPPQR